MGIKRYLKTQDLDPNEKKNTIKHQYGTSGALAKPRLASRPSPTKGSPLRVRGKEVGVREGKGRAPWPLER